MIKACQFVGLWVRLDDSLGFIKAWDEFLNLSLFRMQEKDVFKTCCCFKCFFFGEDLAVRLF
jgi:hypothetical protein